MGVSPVTTTPVQRLDAVSAAVGRRVYAKREDLTAPDFGGNKARKLAPLLDEAVQNLRAGKPDDPALLARHLYTLGRVCKQRADYPGAIEALTADHTLGAMGITGPSAAKLSRAIGVFDEVDVDLTVDEARPGDHYLLCSDGLYKMLDEAQIQREVASAATTTQAVDSLIELANERGGRDNVTVVLVRVDDPPLSPDQSGEHRLMG